MKFFPLSFLLVFSAMSGIACVAQAASVDRDTVNDERSKVITNTWGNCVRTKWQAEDDVCAPDEPPPPPKPVVQAPPPPKPAPISREELTIYFDFDKSALTKEAQAKLDHIAGVINSWSEILKVNIVGNADQMGTDSYNQTLSHQRAKNVEAYLDQRSRINTEVVGVQALGESAPVVQCDEGMKREERIACLAKNRRVEVMFEYKK